MNEIWLLMIPNNRSDMRPSPFHSPLCMWLWTVDHNVDSKAVQRTHLFVFIPIRDDYELKRTSFHFSSYLRATAKFSKSLNAIDNAREQFLIITNQTPKKIYIFSHTNERTRTDQEVSWTIFFLLIWLNVKICESVRAHL